MGGSWSRNKGHSFERLIANQLKPLFPGSKRQLEYQIDTCRGVDLSGTGEFRIQCKKLKSYASINTIKEIQFDRALGEVPILVTAADGEPAMAVLYWDDLIDLIRASL